MPVVQCSIKMAAQKSGLTPHVIRIWEKRYGAVSPERTETQRRLYSDDDIERLALLGAATKSGHRIGDIARLSMDELRTLVSTIPPGPDPTAHTPAPAQEALEAAVTAIKQMDAGGLEAVLDRAVVAFGNHGLLEHVAGPLARIVGELWRDGAITAAHEHFFSSALRLFLLQKFRSYAEVEHAPRLIVVTPAGQLHELGAAIIAAAARDMGWRVVYLGANLPATDIAGAAIQHKATAVALSIVFPGDDPALPDELVYLRKLLPGETAILAGGRAAASYAATLKTIGAHWAHDLKMLYQYLERGRLPR